MRHLAVFLLLWLGQEQMNLNPSGSGEVLNSGPSGSLRWPEVVGGGVSFHTITGESTGFSHHVDNGSARFLKLESETVLYIDEAGYFYVVEPGRGVIEEFANGVH